MLNCLIIDKLKKIKQLQNIVELDDLKYTTKRRINYDFSKS